MPAWQIRNNTHALNGEAFAEASTAEQCLAECVRDRTCVGVDVDYGPTTLCWKHYDTADFDGARSRSNVYLYELRSRCAGGWFLRIWGFVPSLPKWSVVKRNIV